VIGLLVAAYELRSPVALIGALAVLIVALLITRDPSKPDDA
jgi:hypothetical protein